MITLVAESVIFYSKNDEFAFFEWIRNIPCIVAVNPAGSSLFIDVKSKNISKKCLMDIIALFYRYKIEMRQLSKLISKKNALWVMNDKMYWFNYIFDNNY